MALTLERVLGINVEIDTHDPILKQVTPESQRAYLYQRGFIQIDSSITNFENFEHPQVLDRSGKKDYLFGISICIDMHKDHEILRLRTIQRYLTRVQDFYETKGEKVPTKLQILNELV